jgi:hypothetical protein
MEWLLRITESQSCSWTLSVLRSMLAPLTKPRSRPSILGPKHNAPKAPSSTMSQPHLNPRSRLISMDSGDMVAAAACVTPTSPRIMTTIGIGDGSLDNSCFLLSDEDSQPILLKPSGAPKDLPKKKRAVGKALREGVQWKGTLRKKFSWKSFPELETYLVDHRAQYLEYSSSLNYTKAQKLYNNKLTQGLLDLAAAEGYTFEGFSFAAVRDRIRCFYKSYVQATKKKKRTKRS